MRGIVNVSFGRREYPLLPTFSVMDSFEDRCGALTAHLLNLTQGTATLKARATLVFFAMKSGAESDGGTSQGMSIQNTMEAMWEAGAADNDLLLREVELIERLLYTPEQFQAKKEERERTEAALKMMDIFQTASPDFSASLQPSSDGSLESFGEQPRESSSPA